jgi:lysophospholipase L1-like esterase
MTESHQTHNLLFIGDSITDAFRREEELNESFQLGNGYVFLIMAQLRSQHPEMNLLCKNRGVSGQTLLEISNRWERDALSEKPTLLTLLAGVNDVIRAQKQSGRFDAPDEFEKRLSSMMESARNQLPETRLVLMEPFLVEAGEVTKAWRAVMKPYQDAVRRQALHFNAHFLPLQGMFDRACDQAPPEHWSYDGIHPNPGGFMLMANAWLTQFLEEWKTA